ncbi:sedoheptulose 7-phosphate cyclase [Streptomyces sp. PRh5]|uniref:sedoheptulose 7-phosphate cyclase n=1 Tax=Streptomyces sp. PRh5 TaxID=1158056 RepID=UPI0004AF4427|nr:sedoheptulose 7-phosphate cyclase [Streptomyces sp. PRh5]
MIEGGRWAIKANQTVEYEVVETTDLLNPDNPQLASLPGQLEGTGSRLIILDQAIEGLCGRKVRRYFGLRGIPVEYLTLPTGDEHKTLDNVLRVTSRLNTLGTSRLSTPPIAIGGGVVQDTVGMAASLYRRGIPYIRVPTTLLGQIDGSVSAKNGVNYEGHRNRLGTFTPPPRTLIDRAFLSTLPERQIRSGLAEALKLALVKDPQLFAVLEKYGPSLVAERLQDSSPETSTDQPGRTTMHRAIAGMAEELQKNLWETDLQRIVDYGHTFSPLIEMKALPELLHGEAVAMDCVFSAILANQRELLSGTDLLRIINTVEAIGLRPSHPLFTDEQVLTLALEETMRHRNNQQIITLLDGIGRTIFINDLTQSEISTAASKMRNLVGSK